VRRAALLLGLCMPLTSLAAPAHGATAKLEVDAVDASAHPDVVATVTAPKELSGAQLPAKAFTVAEEGERRRPVVRRVATDDLEVLLVIDTSGSMRGAPIEAAKRAASAFLTNMPPSVRIGVIGFGQRPEVASPLAADRAKLAFAIGGLRASGETSLYDAVALAVEQFSPGGRARRSIVLLSDGGDTASTASLPAAEAKLVASGVHVDAAELVTPDSDRTALSTLTAAGNGRVVAAADPSALAGVYDGIAASIANQYRVRFRATSQGPTKVHLAVAHDGVVAESVITVDLPAAPSTTAAPPRPHPEARPAPSPGFLASGWALATGAVAVFGALLMLGVTALGPRRPRAGRDRLGRSGGEARPQRAINELASRASTAAETVLERRGRRRSLNDALERAGIALRPGEFAVLAVSTAAATLLVTSMLAGPVLGFLVAGVAVACFRLFLTVRTDRRRSRFADQLGDTLQLLSGSLRAGYGLLQAVDAVAREAEAPTAQEFRRLVIETRLGRDLSDALHAMAARVGSDDFEWVVQAIDIHREVGGDLAEVLDTVAGTIRERNQLRRQVKALSAEGRLSAYVLIALPIALFVLLSFTNRDYITELTRGAGLVLSAVALTLMVAGAFWLKKICRLVF
jgi:tight adherence protein B